MLTASLVAICACQPAPRATPRSTPAAAPEATPESVFLRGFESDAQGAAPAGFSAAQRGGPAGRWVVRPRSDAAEGRMVVVQEDADATDSRFALLIDDAFEATDLRLSVRCRPVSGTVDQAVGLVFRLRDADNYYLTRANALEGNVRLYRVKAGRREQIASWEGEISAGRWHELAVEAQGEHLSVSWDGQRVIETTDAIFRQPGRVGLWTKADSISEFDALAFERRDR